MRCDRLHWNRLSLLLTAVAAVTVFSIGGVSYAAEGLPAFPGAEGFGSTTRGGRGGRVIEVTNLNNDGPGSFRDAVYAEGPRIIVFRIGGLIDLDGGISIRNPYVTIAGQTSPGDGVCLKNGVFHIGTHDVVVRYLRVRPGDRPGGGNPENRDCIDVSGDGDKVFNIVVDHCSFSWGLDENVATWYGPRDVTFQWCITSESLHDSLHPKGPHGMGMILGSQDNTITVHHCLLAHNNGRNALIGDTGKNRGPSLVDFCNNVIYNHGRFSCTNVRGTTRINYVGNYIKMGLDGSQKSPRGCNFSANNEQLFYVRGNVWPSMIEAETDATAVLGAVLGPNRTPTPERLISPQPIPVPPVTTESATDAYESVLRHVGATLPVRDVVDARVIEETRRGDGRIIDTQADVGGWPVYASAEPPADSDHDGMPDDWEKEHGLAADDANDGAEDMDGDGYTNVEEYLNRTNPKQKTAGAAIPHRKPVVQQGNDALRYGKARVEERPRHYNAEDRAEFVAAVKASGKEVAEHLGITFVKLSPGEFLKGKTKVILTKPFEMATCEITQKQWTAVMETRPWSDRDYVKDDADDADNADNAVTYVSWHDAQEFVARLNACGDWKYRLPTVAEWEYAARAGRPGWWFTEEDIGQYAWHFDNTIRRGETYAHRVGQKKPNPWGLCDMAGNVHEWCHDWYEYWYWSAERGDAEKTDPAGPRPGSYYRDYHMLRGGSFYYRPRDIFASVARQSHHRPEYRNFDVGFRLVRMMP